MVESRRRMNRFWPAILALSAILLGGCALEGHTCDMAANPQAFEGQRMVLKGAVFGRPGEMPYIWLSCQPRRRMPVEWDEWRGSTADAAPDGELTGRVVRDPRVPGGWKIKAESFRYFLL
jgi:hypothetical protein